MITYSERSMNGLIDMTENYDNNQILNESHKYSIGTPYPIFCGTIYSRRVFFTH